MATSAQESRSPLEPLWLAAALRARARFEPSEHAELRGHALAARSFLDGARELEDDSLAAHALRREAALSALRAFLVARAAKASAAATALPALLEAARAAGLEPALADALGPLDEPDAGSSSHAHTPLPAAVSAEWAIAKTLRTLEWRTRAELLWLRVVRSLALAALLGGSAFLAMAVLSARHAPPAAPPPSVPAPGMRPGVPPPPPRPTLRPPAQPGTMP